MNLRKEAHWTVEGYIDGEWLSNDLVFPSAKDAIQHGEKLEEEGVVSKFRLRRTTEPVNLPKDEESEDEEDGDDEGEEGVQLARQQ